MDPARFLRSRWRIGAVAGVVIVLVATAVLVTRSHDDGSTVGAPRHPSESSTSVAGVDEVGSLPAVDGVVVSTPSSSSSTSRPATTTTTAFGGVGGSTTTTTTTAAPLRPAVNPCHPGRPVALRSERPILFAGLPGGGGSFDVFAVDRDGADLRRLTTGGGRSAVWSPDGRAIAYLADLDARLFVMDADGSNSREVTIGEGRYRGVANVVWSPDGMHFGASMFTANGLRVVGVAGVDGSRFIALSGDDGIATALAFSPDGSTLLYQVDGDVWTAPAAGGPAFRVASGASAGAASWSPDGCQLALVDPSEPAVILYGWDGTRQRVVARVKATHVLWAPTGDHLLLEIGPRIEIVDPDGRNRRVLRDADAFSLAWSPDGTACTFYARPSSSAEFDIWVLAVDGGPAVDVSSQRPERDVDPNW